jgi:hypothetical protein
MFRRNGRGRPSIIPPPATPRLNGSSETRMIEPDRRTEEALPLYFLHIAKTGGTSLTAALKAFYHAEEVISDAVIFRSILSKLGNTAYTRLSSFTATRNTGLCPI